jgi:hypothetical protein
VLLVIFGAGASYDSVRHFPPPKPSGGYAQNNFSPIPEKLQPLYEEFRPPLANQLFDDRPQFVRVMGKYPACKPLVNLLRGDIQVERQLAKFENEAKTFPIRNRQLAAIRYYLHEMLWTCQAHWQTKHEGITNYSTFIDALDQWGHIRNEQICFVTFNYDTMLEDSLPQHWETKFHTLTSYIDNPHFKLIKLHGSLDWALKLNNPPNNGEPNSVIEAALKHLDISETYHKVGDYSMYLGDGTYGFPAIAIPVQMKSQFACPPEHLSALVEVLPEVRKIITIAWRATEQHFLDVLKNRLTGLKTDVDLLVVSGSIDGATETQGNLGLVKPQARHKNETVVDGFSGLINRISQLEDFLY